MWFGSLEGRSIPPVELWQRQVQVFNTCTQTIVIIYLTPSRPCHYSSRPTIPGSSAPYFRLSSKSGTAVLLYSRSESKSNRDIFTYLRLLKPKINNLNLSIVLCFKQQHSDTKILVSANYIFFFYKCQSTVHICICCLFSMLQKKVQACDRKLNSPTPFQARTVAVRPLPFYTIINLF